MKYIPLFSLSMHLTLSIKGLKIELLSNGSDNPEIRAFNSAGKTEGLTGLYNIYTVYSS